MRHRHPGRRRRGRLSLRIYLYTVCCVVVALALFLLLAVWLRPAPQEARGIPTRLLLFSGGMLLAINLVASLLFARSLVRPLRRLRDAAEAFGRGEQTARARVDQPDEIGAVGRAFDRMADRVTRMVSAQRDLMANVSHELRTPLARIRVALELAADGDAATARELLAEIDRDLGELERLVDEVLTSVRLDVSLSGLRTEEVGAGEIVERAAQRFRTHYPTHPLAVSVPAELPQLRAEPALLRRAIDNLLDNARKYSEPGSPIDLRARLDGGGVAVEVEDRGIGIAPADLDNLFTPFFRADRSRQRGTGGVGLGLSLARKIIESHGGKIDVTSVEGRGSTFRVWLPAG
jgi:signal transduction histidine kinase